MGLGTYFAEVNKRQSCLCGRDRDGVADRAFDHDALAERGGIVSDQIPAVPGAVRAGAPDADIRDPAVGVANLSRYFIDNERRADIEVVDVIFCGIFCRGDYNVCLGRRNAGGQSDRRRERNADQIRSGRTRRLRLLRLCRARQFPGGVAFFGRVFKRFEVLGGRLRQAVELEDEILGRPECHG